MTLQKDFDFEPKFSVSYQPYWLQSEIKVKYPYGWDRVQIFCCISQLRISRARNQCRHSASGWQKKSPQHSETERFTTVSD